MFGAPFVTVVGERGRGDVSAAEHCTRAGPARTRSAGGGFCGATLNWTPPLMWHELKERHLDFWNEETLQSFWAGNSFYIPGDSNELSYSLAEVFVRLLSESKEKVYLERFLEHARPEDAGQGAALDILETDLGEIAGTFLGPGKWRPSPAAISKSWKQWGIEEDSSTSG